MSDINIPGVSSKYNTEKLIDTIMKAERVPLERMQDRKDEYAQEKKAWSSMNQRLTQLADNANKLYGFENPFQNYVANSSDSSVLTATTDRTAKESIESIKVLQTAKKDVFHSRSLPRDYQVPAGEYGFKLGDQEVSFSFDGGDLEDFAERVRNRGKGLVTARTVRNTPDTQVIVFDGGKTGEKNSLSFLQDSIPFGEKAGILEKNISKERSITPTAQNVSAAAGSGAESFSLTDGGVKVEPQGSAQIAVSPPVQLKEPLQLKIRVQIENISKDEYTPPSPPQGPSIPSGEGVELEGVTVQGKSSRVDLPEWEAPEPPKEVDDLQVLSLNGSKDLPALEDTESTQTVTVDAAQVSGLSGGISSLEIDNRNTHRRVGVQSVELVDPEARGDYSPARPGTKAADARLEVNGVEVERPNNNIDDLIPGVTIQAKQASDRPVELEVEPDKESIKNAIFNFIGSYNRALTEINILTSNRESVIEEISYFEEGEKEAAREKLGLFQGESSFMQLKNRLQRMVAAPYDTSEGRDLSMLSQMGISTNASGFSGSVSRSRLRGYLELDESKLDEAIENQLPAVKQLFGRDTDGDLVVDSGLAYEMNEYVRSYTRSGGVIPTRIAGIENRIERTNEDITDFKDKLERKEQDLKRKYGRMESTLGELEKNEQAIQRFNSQSGQ